MHKPDPDKIAEFARRIEQENDPTIREAIQQEFLTFAAGFIDQFSGHYGDFAPRPDGNILCTMAGYVQKHRRVAYVIDVRTGFIWPLEEDAQRGGKYQQIGHSTG